MVGGEEEGRLHDMTIGCDARRRSLSKNICMCMCVFHQTCPISIYKYINIIYMYMYTHTVFAHSLIGWRLHFQIVCFKRTCNGSRAVTAPDASFQASPPPPPPPPLASFWGGGGGRSPFPAPCWGGEKGSRDRGCSRYHSRTCQRGSTAG